MLRALLTLTSVVVVMALITSTASAAVATPIELLRGTPFEAEPNAAVVPHLMRGGVVRRSSLDGTLVSDDWRRLHDLGFERSAHSAVVVLHYVPKSADVAKQVARVRTLARSIDGFAPSNACDRITREGEGTALCTGSFDGPLGKVPVRMGVASTLREDEGSGAGGGGSGNGNGAMHLVIRNVRPLEAKPFLSWGRIVEPDHLKIAVDLFPTAEGWFVYTRVAVEMSDHKSSAKTITDTLLRIDSWLCRDLSRLQ